MEGREGWGVRTMVGSARMLYRSSHTSRQAACCFALDAAKECKYTCTSHRIILTKEYDSV